MLWTALFSDRNLLGDRAYVLPHPVHAFMLGLRDSFWARMQGRFTSGSYDGGAWPRYFNSDKSTSPRASRAFST